MSYLIDLIQASIILIQRTLPPLNHPLNPLRQPKQPLILSFPPHQLQSNRHALPCCFTGRTESSYVQPLAIA